MHLSLRGQLAQFAHVLQTTLFPAVERETGPLTPTAQRLVAVLAMLPLGRFVPPQRGWRGRPAKDRLAIASALVAKVVYNLATTRQLLDRLHSDEQLRRLCGWQQAEQIPHEATFSRAFAEFAVMELPQQVHEALIEETQKSRLVGHIARDSTAIEARERYAEPPPAPPARPKFRPWSRKKSRKRNAARHPKTRLERQREMKLSDMLAELPRHCSLGVKTSSGGNQKYWRGYKLHLDVADGQIPISAILTAASLHDSQVAIPLATMTAQRVTSLYDVMDSAYDATAIVEHSRSLGHVPIVKPAKRRPRASFFGKREAPRQFSWIEEERFKQRTIVERVNARLKEEFGGRFLYVRGAQKVMAHLMFGVLALTVDQLLRLGG